MADIERVIMSEGRSALDDLQYTSEIFNAVVLDWEGQPEGRSVREVGGQVVEMTVRPYVDPRTGGQRYALYLNGETEELSDFNSLKSAQAAYREQAFAFAGDRDTMWTDTDVRSARAEQRRNGYPISPTIAADLAGPPRAARSAAPGQGSLLDLAAAEQAEPAITANREPTVDAARPAEAAQPTREELDQYMRDYRARRPPVNEAAASAYREWADLDADAREDALEARAEEEEREQREYRYEEPSDEQRAEREALLDDLSDEDREALAEYDRERAGEAAADIAEAEEEAGADEVSVLAPAAEARGDVLTEAEQIVLSDEFLAPYYEEQAARDAEARVALGTQALLTAEEGVTVEASTGSYTLEAWAEELDRLGDVEFGEGEEEYDRDVYAPDGLGGLRELTAEEIEARAALWVAVYDHGDDLGHADVVGAYDRDVALRQQAEEAAVERAVEAMQAEIWGERGELLDELQQEAGGPVAEQDEMSAALAALVADLNQAQAQPGAGENLDQVLAAVAEIRAGLEPTPDPAAPPATTAAAQRAGTETTPAPALREAMAGVLQAARGDDLIRSSPEYETITALWSSAERFMTQANELMTHYGQELRQDIRTQGMMRAVGSRLADGLAGASVRMSGWMIANEAANHPVTRALHRLAATAQEWGERLRGGDPVVAMAEFQERRDAVSALVAAEREQLAATPQLRDGGELAGARPGEIAPVEARRDPIGVQIDTERGELAQTPKISDGGALEGGESAADLVAQMFDGSPVERMHEAVAAAESADQSTKPERPKTAALAAQSSGAEL